MHLAKFANDLLEAIQRVIEILARNDERRRQTNNRMMRRVRQHAFQEKTLANLTGARKPGVKVGSRPQSAATDRFERRAADRAQTPQHMVAQQPAALDQSFLANDIKRLEPDCSRQRIATKSRAVRSWCEYIHYFAPRDKGGDWQHSATQSLAQHHAVRLDVLVLKGEPRPAAAEARLDFVEQQKDVALVAQPAQASQSAAR